MEDTKSDKKRFTEADMLHLASLVDLANDFGVPWLNSAILAIQAPTKRQREKHLRGIEQQVALEATRVDNPHAHARRILAHIRVNTSLSMADETAAALLIAAEIAAGDFKTLGFEIEPERITTPNGDDTDKTIGFFVYDNEPKQTKARKKPRPQTEDDE